RPVADAASDPAQDVHGAAALVLGRLGHRCAALAVGFEAVAPAGDLHAHEPAVPGHFLRRVGGDDRGDRRPAVPALAVATLETGAFCGAGRTADPLPALILGAPLAHAAEVGHHAVQLLGRGCDLDGLFDGVGHDPKPTNSPLCAPVRFFRPPPVEGGAGIKVGQEGLEPGELRLHVLAQLAVDLDGFVDQLALAPR